MKGIGLSEQIARIIIAIVFIRIGIPPIFIIAA